MAQVPIIVLVEPDRFDTAVRALSDAGVLIDSQQRAIGTIGGRVGIDQLAAVAEVDGVVAVERQRTIRQPPPESEIQ